MHCHIFGALKNDERKRKPKVAIIDTGYDGKARWLSNQFKARLSQLDENGQISQNWKDFWESEDQPHDDFGHGTSMLYTIMRIAPFANVCVARIAGNGEHLRKEPSRTSKNLAEVGNPDFVVVSIGEAKIRGHRQFVGLPKSKKRTLSPCLSAGKEKISSRNALL